MGDGGTVSVGNCHAPSLPSLPHAPQAPQWRVSAYEECRALLAQGRTASHGSIGGDAGST